MPPRGHSHSSHSSSSRSSHSSSRSSSRSSSSRSSSSYRSSSSSSYGNYGSGWRGNARPSSASYNRPTRTRTNQPTGYSSSGGGSASSLIRCRTHDYIYYPSSWTDPDTGRYYAKGYYDEDGKYYDKIVTKKSGHYETKYSCEYCGSEVNLKWDEGQQPLCPNCGATLTSSREWVVDEISEETTTYRPNEYTKQSGCLKGFVVVAVFAVIAFIISIFNRNANTTDTNRTDTDNYDDSIYVNSIGREIYWNDAYDSYYDEKTDCYLVYNDEVDPPIWQYWYEGISSDYGDYGWMEWDYEENCWYIESDSGWDRLPSKYNDDGRLWHF